MKDDDKQQCSDLGLGERVRRVKKRPKAVIKILTNALERGRFKQNAHDTQRQWKLRDNADAPRKVGNIWMENKARFSYKYVK